MLNELSVVERLVALYSGGPTCERHQQVPPLSHSHSPQRHLSQLNYGRVMLCDSSMVHNT